jgi:protein disulfide-isomerase
MKKNLITLFTLALFTAAPLFVFAADNATATTDTLKTAKSVPNFVEKSMWSTDFEAAKKQAAEKKLTILVDFTGSDWCPWCVRLEKEVFSQDAFKNYAKDNLVLVKADFPRKVQLPDAEKKQNDALVQKYSIEGFPTILLLNAEGKVLGQTGYQEGGAAAYVQHLKDLLAAAKKQ